MHSLVIGMGIGSLYAKVLREAGHIVTTVDTNPAVGADYATVDAALAAKNMYDTVHICTPNFTHYELANKVATQARIVFVEKPGVETAEQWEDLVLTHICTRFMLVKNNQHRENIDTLISLARSSTNVKLHWINKNRVPHAGSWFTTASQAFGGVSRDLLPHLLSFVSYFEPNFEDLGIIRMEKQQRWQLSDLTNTEYGTVNQNGTYNVDDFAMIAFNSEDNSRRFELVADWRSNVTDDRSIEFVGTTGSIKFQLGLCPEPAYIAMIETAFRNLNNDAYWDGQFAQDMWIHRTMEII
ncbi:MviM Predicted dehydrogenases and related proteins [uncultured Caudovirales phage]|uniref:MviM Predicted dehydrogenases and related proteins n=1 Tax=uncultured Caudovirales phage TaxID=2100421 RepID=A0A6J5LA90_9CAUD|nr:MviM Predicted dehydrogenases and related proteins [uncultured Caudovirales phage]